MSSTGTSSAEGTSANKSGKTSSSRSNGLALDRRESESDEDKRTAKVSEKDRKIGHRRINEEGEVSYKKVQSNQLIASIQLGIQYSVGVMTKYDERDLLMQDFMTVESNGFPKGGGQFTPAHTYTDFKFSTFAPLAFRYFLNLFGVKREDFMMSICNDSLRELSNPGASGSMFFLTNDDEFILKTVMHKESEFLQKLLPGYYMNLNQNPHTLLPKFFGMFCYQIHQKNIRLTVMNNILPSDVKMHLKFDLKGSTYKRKASKRERAKTSPTFKDLDFMELLPEGLLLEAETYNALITTLRRDSRVLESFRIMDYSLLVGVHNLDLAAKEEDASGIPSPTRAAAKQRAIQKAKLQKQKLVSHSTAMESIQAQTEPIDEQEHLPPGGIPARNHKGERLLLYLGIIDILQSYEIRKKLEHTFKAIIHDGDTVSVHRPSFYAHRFLDFMADKVFKKIPSLDLPEIKGTHRKFRSIVSSIIAFGGEGKSGIALKHSPSKKGKKDSALRRISTVKQTNAGNTTSSATADSGKAATLSDEVNALSEKASNLNVTAAVTKLESTTSSSPNENMQQNEGSQPDQSCESPSNMQPIPGNLSADYKNPSNLEGSYVGCVSNPNSSEYATSAGTTYNQQPETLNLPAVLWDKPLGSKIRVPPPVPPRSPRRPIDPISSGAFEAAMATPFCGGSSEDYISPQRGDFSYSSMGMTSGQRPDVVPGNSIESAAIFHEPMATGLSPSEIPNENSSNSALNQAAYNSASSSVSTSQHYSRYNSSTSDSYRETNKVVTRGITDQSYLSGTIDSNASPSLSRKSKHPHNRQTSAIKKQSIDSIGSDYSSISNRGAGSTGGTPSRLYVGRGAGSGWNTPTPANTWNTEGTPSYTASSLSGGASLGETGPSAGVGHPSDRNMSDTTVGKSDRKRKTKKIETFSYQETEM